MDTGDDNALCDVTLGSKTDDGERDETSDKLIVKLYVKSIDELKSETSVEERSTNVRLKNSDEDKTPKDVIVLLKTVSVWKLLF